MKSLALPALPPGAAGYAVIGVVGVAFLLWVLKGGGARSIGGSIGALPGNFAGGVVEGIGDSLGVPRTDQTECDRALAEGRLWDASFACPAGRFVSGVFTSRTGPAPINTQADTSGVPFY
jgi:fructose-specific phosphotransferase system IIC component